MHIAPPVFEKARSYLNLQLSNPPPAGAAASVKGAASLAGTVIAGALSRRIDLRDAANGRLRDVAAALVSVSM